MYSSEKDDGERLSRKDAQNGGQRIHGGVCDGWRVGVGEIRGEGERRRVGHAPGEKAAEIHKVHLQDAPRKDTDKDEGDHGDTRSGKQPLQAGCAEGRLKELRPGAQASRCEEKRNPEVAKG